jgi:hypothetical protein
MISNVGRQTIISRASALSPLIKTNRERNVTNYGFEKENALCGVVIERVYSL